VLKQPRMPSLRQLVPGVRRHCGAPCHATRFAVALFMLHIEANAEVSYHTSSGRI